MHRKLLIPILILLPLIFLTSCYDADEIDDNIHIICLGIDRGVSDKWRLTVQFATRIEEQGGGGAMSSSSNGDKESNGDSSNDQGGYSFITVDGPSFFGCIELLNTSMAGRISFMHAHILIFSKDLAESGLIGEFIAPIIRYREIRRNMHVFVTRGTAMDFIKDNKPYIGTSLSKSMHVLLDEGYDTGFFPIVTLQDFYNGLKSTYDQPIATLVDINDFENFQKHGEVFGTNFHIEGNYYAGDVPRDGGKKVELLGTAVFDGDKMVGELTGDETRTLLIVTGKYKTGFYTIPDPNQPELIIPLDVKPATKPKVKLTFKDGKAKIKLDIELEGDILAIQSRIQYEKPDLKKVLEENFENIMKERIDKLIDKCKDLNADILQFGRHACMQFITIQEWEDYDWHGKFKDIEVISDVSFTIRRSGSQQDSSSIQSSEGRE